MADDLQHLGVRPSKSRGQSFLVDEGVARRQVLAARLGPGQEVMEIGGGLGILTVQLARTGASVRVIEVEPALATHLRSLDLPGVAVEEADALGAPWGHPQKIVANIPYSLSSQLVERMVRQGPGTCVLLLQREFAERLAARPGTKSWSRLAALVQRDYAVEILEVVPRNAFSPQPVVQSAVIRIARRETADAAGFEKYAELVGALFAHRRKKIRNSLPAAAALFSISAAEAVEEAERMGLAQRRPEEISCADFDALAKALAGRRTHK